MCKLMMHKDSSSNKKHVLHDLLTDPFKVHNLKWIVIAMLDEKF